MEQNSSNLFDLQLENQSISYLGETARWAKFLAIVGFIFCALIAIMGIFISSFLSKYNDTPGMPTGFSSAYGTGMTIFYLVVAIIMVFPYLFLLRFANAMQTALKGNDQPNMITAFRNLKSFFKFVGIVTIIGLCFYALAILAAVLGSLAGR